MIWLLIIFILGVPILAEDESHTGPLILVRPDVLQKVTNAIIIYIGPESGYEKDSGWATAYAWLWNDDSLNGSLNLTGNFTA